MIVLVNQGLNSNKEGIMASPVQTTKSPKELCLEIIEKHARPLDLFIEVNLKNNLEKGWNMYYFSFDVSGVRHGVSNNWFCFSIILTEPELQFGVWTRESFEYGIHPYDVVKTDRVFDPTSFDAWLGEWFENEALEELTRSSDS